MGKTDGMRNVVKINTSKITSVMETMLRLNRIPFFIGMPGIGKTYAVKEHAERAATEQKKNFVPNPTYDDWNDTNYCFSTIISSTIEELDVNGAIIVRDTATGKVTSFVASEMFPAQGTGIIFLDEFPNGRESVQNAFQHILYEHKVGNRRISPDIMFVLAGNRPDDNCATFNIPSALRNRVGWFEIIPDNLDVWSEKMGKKGNPISHELIGFLKSPLGEKFVDNFNPKSDQYAYVTRRTLHMASDVIDAIGDKKERAMLIAGFLGTDFSSEFDAFLKLSEKVELKTLIDKPELINNYINDIGVLYSICTSLVSHVKDEATAEQVFNVMEAMEAKEYGAFVFKSLMLRMKESTFIKYITSCKSGQKVLSQYKDIIKSGD